MAVWLHGAMVLLALLAATREVKAEKLEAIRIADDRTGFVGAASGHRFVPWGLNYDHDEQGRLLEDYWEKEWGKVEEDFREMQQLGANLVRVHLQLARFMDGPQKPHEPSLKRLERLLSLAEQLRLRLDITGLGCYHKHDVPPWYDQLSEDARWDVQARFWEAVAGRCAHSSAVFCYDLMNEPVVPGGRRNPGEWLGPAFAGKHFVQFITLDQKDRPRPHIARQWCHTLAAAIRKHDPQRLVTVGLVPWSLDRPGLTSGFVPREIAGELDFLSVHLYPEANRLKEALTTLTGFSVGKPVVVEEMFPLRCTIDELRQFVEASRGAAAGWVGFYWGKTIEECRRSTAIHDALMLAWLEYFRTRPL